MIASAQTPISICVVASGDWASFSRVNCHEIAARWTPFGRVCYIEPAPLRAPRFHDAARLVGRLRGAVRNRSAPRPADVEVVAPAFLPWSPVTPVRAWNVRAAARAVRRRAAERQWPFCFDVLWFFSESLAGLEAQIPHRLVIYHSVDDYAGNPGVNRQLVRAQERALLKAADVVFAASEPLAARLQNRHRNVVVWENVSDTEALLAGPVAGNGVPRSPRPVAAFVGNLSAHKVDFPLVLDVVRGMSDWEFVLAGPLGELSDSGRRLMKQPNVTYLGPLERRDLPQALGRADVALLPLPTGDLHESSFPMKLLDYFALGLPVVGRRTPPLARFGDVVFDARSPSEYRTAMERARHVRGQEAFQRRAKELALENSWSGRIANLENCVRVMLSDKTAR